MSLRYKNKLFPPKKNVSKDTGTRYVYLLIKYIGHSYINTYSFIDLMYNLDKSYWANSRTCSQHVGIN